MPVVVSSRVLFQGVKGIRSFLRFGGREFTEEQYRCQRSSCIVLCSFCLVCCECCLICLSSADHDHILELGIAETGKDNSQQTSISDLSGHFEYWHQNCILLSLSFRMFLACEHIAAWEN